MRNLIFIILIIIFNIYKLMINNFDDYIFDSYLFESILYFSPRFRERIENMEEDSKIAKDLLKKQGQDIPSDITLIDINEDDDNYLTFMPIKKAQTIIDVDYKSHKANPTDKRYDLTKHDNRDLNDYLWIKRTTLKNSIYNDSSRNRIKLGKFINKVLNNKYKPNEIEKFINIYKSNLENSEEIIDIVQGEDINYWYNRDNHLSDIGTLGRSCMSNKKGYFDIYVDNPETCKLVILKLGGKLLGRALLWKIHEISSPDEKRFGKINSEWFLDRIYSIEEYQSEKIANWAIKRGYVIKWKNSNFYNSDIIYNKYIYKKTKISVKVKPKEYSKYPYLDTLSRYDSKLGILYNDDNKRKVGHILRDVMGSYAPSITRPRAYINRFADFITGRP